MQWYFNKYRVLGNSSWVGPVEDCGGNMVKCLVSLQPECVRDSYVRVTLSWRPWILDKSSLYLLALFILFFFFFSHVRNVKSFLFFFAQMYATDFQLLLTKNFKFCRGKHHKWWGWGFVGVIPLGSTPSSSALLFEDFCSKDKIKISDKRTDVKAMRLCFGDLVYNVKLKWCCWLICMLYREL